jgi:hypothetical protein
MNQIKFPGRPEMLAESYPLAPTAIAPDVVKASVSVDIARDASGHGTLRYAILPSSLNGAVYWSSSGRNVDPADTPRIVIDYETAKP